MPRPKKVTADTIFETKQLMFLSQPKIDLGPNGNGLGLRHWRYVRAIVVTPDNRILAQFLHTDGKWHGSAGLPNGYFFPRRDAEVALRIVEKSMRRHPRFVADQTEAKPFRDLLQQRS